MKDRIVPTFLVSENLDCVGYKLGQLFIRFKSGIAYSYDGVPFDYYDAIQKVESAGKFFHRFIRGKFHYSKLDSDPFAVK
jgi:hypothetical protein